MALITLRQLLDHAAEHGYGVPAFNINNMEQGLAIMEAAKATDAPVIIQASRGARSYANDIMLAKMIEALAAIYPDIPLCMHQDHGNNEATCMTAIRHGFTSVMMDGSLEADGKTPASYDYNVAITERVARMAHWVGASVEGELGVLGSLFLGQFLVGLLNALACALQDGLSGPPHHQGQQRNGQHQRHEIHPSRLAPRR